MRLAPSVSSANLAAAAGTNASLVRTRNKLSTPFLSGANCAEAAPVNVAMPSS